MNCRALMKTESFDAEAVSRSLDADNKQLDGLSVRSGCAEGFIVSEVEAESLSTILSTLDDLIGCQITSEKMMGDG